MFKDFALFIGREMSSDFPVGKTKKGNWKTCDRTVYEKDCLKYITENIDFCREHYSIAKAACELNRKASK